LIRKGQSILEFVLIFIIVAVLILGLLALWGWSRNNIPARQVKYEGTRVQAGSKSSSGEPAIPFKATPITDSQTYLFRR